MSRRLKSQILSEDEILENTDVELELTEADSKDDDEEDSKKMKKSKCDDEDKSDKDEDDSDDEDDDSEDDDEDDKDMKESFANIFAGQNLSEEFESKISTLFEAAVNESANKKATKLNEAYKTSLIESVEAKIEDLSENIDKYMTYAVSTFMEENEIAIESGIKVEMAESLLNSLKETMSEHNIIVDEDSVDLVEELEGEITTLKTASNKVINDNIKLAEEVKQLYADRAFDEVSEGLTDVERDRMAVLSENFSIRNIEKYKEDLSTIRESFFESNRAPNTLHEPIINLTETTVPAGEKMDESVAAIMAGLKAIKRS